MFNLLKIKTNQKVNGEKLLKIYWKWKNLQVLVKLVIIRNILKIMMRMGLIINILNLMGSHLRSNWLVQCCSRYMQI